MEGQISVEKI